MSGSRFSTATASRRSCRDPAGSNGNDRKRRGAISAIVADVEPLIGETSVVFRLAGGDSLVGMFAEDMDALTPGLPVQIAVQSDGIELSSIRKPSSHCAPPSAIAP